MVVGLYEVGPCLRKHTTGDRFEGLEAGHTSYSLSASGQTARTQYSCSSTFPAMWNGKPKLLPKLLLVVVIHQSNSKHEYTPPLPLFAE